MTKVLVAEDDAFLAKMYQMHLQMEGIDVHVVFDGQEAIAAIEQEPPGVLLLDLLMPNVDGFAVMEHIRDAGLSIPVLILSNLSQEIDREKCHELGAKDFFVKSDMDLSDLSSMIKKYI